MIGTGSGMVAVGIGAVMFGVLYALVVFIPLHGKHEGYTSLLVVGGVMGTLVFVGLVYGFEIALGVGLIFVGTGGPMVAGEAIKTKYEELREARRLAAEIEEMLHDDSASVTE